MMLKNDRLDLQQKLARVSMWLKTRPETKKTSCKNDNVKKMILPSLVLQHSAKNAQRTLQIASQPVPAWFLALSSVYDVALRDLPVPESGGNAQWVMGKKHSAMTSGKCSLLNKRLYFGVLVFILTWRESLIDILLREDISERTEKGAERKDKGAVGKIWKYLWLIQKTLRFISLTFIHSFKCTNTVSLVVRRFCSYANQASLV